MFALCLLGSTAAVSVGIIIAVMRRAPEAYEDERGLTIIRDVPAKSVQLDPAILHAGRSDNDSGGWANITQPVRRRSAEQLQKSFSGKFKTFHTFAALFHPHGKPASAHR
jgi:hypothetical protein